ncbi:hypothetical protein FSP39_014458 [Pinctada imbricata]|uniref:COP9 signalosome complex subunit 8 n=1 Tax=Pinctada imbricata TaxID=66713 RepID=A0AA89BI13_PINIB|nr:hypothetical protein FSP39_014458 [Pinctada imbricata]
MVPIMEGQHADRRSSHGNYRDTAEDYRDNLTLFKWTRRLRDLHLYIGYAPGGVGSPQLYSQLLALYLLHNETCNAKFLWKRIPQATKSTTPELATIWNIGQKLWLRDYPGIYEGLKKEWSEHVKFIMDALVDSTRRMAAEIVARAYSSINEEDLAAFLGMSASEAVQTAVSEGWQYDAQTKFVTPKKIAPPSDPIILSEQQLSVLTDYVSFLEG